MNIYFAFYGWNGIKNFSKMELFALVSCCIGSYAHVELFIAGLIVFVQRMCTNNMK